MRGELLHLGTFEDPIDKTIKSVYQNEKGIIETTLLVNKTDRDSDVFCLPTHHYCSLGCKMCHLTKEGMTKPMIQINANNLIRTITRTSHNLESKRRTNNKNGWLSFMGVGEPLLNLNLIKDIFDDEDKIKKACRYKNITYAISTMMPNKNLESFSDYVDENSIPLKIHFSMHSPFTLERLNLLPATKLGVEESLEILANYRKKILKNENIQRNFYKFHSDADPIEIHYTLIENQNDSDKHLKKTIELLRKYKISFKILTFNPIGNLKRSKREEHWLKELKNNLPGLKIKIYNPPGHRVGSSCGEFTKHYYLSELETKKDEQEFKDWKNKYQIFN